MAAFIHLMARFWQWKMEPESVSLSTVCVCVCVCVKLCMLATVHRAGF